MSLLHEIILYLEDRGVLCALIGGVALAVHGIARATLDYDLLVTDRSVLDDKFWANWSGAVSREIRCGDAEDPLAGVVRLSRDDEAVDIVVGRHAWEAQALERRVYVTVEGQRLPAVDRADLVLLKLSAAGPQDLVDVRLLLAADSGDLRRQVEARLSIMPPSVQAAWKNLEA